MSEKIFEWASLGDVGLGRENLGEEMPVIVYRLMQMTIKDVLNEKMGPGQADDVFREAGFRAGLAYQKNVLPPADNFNTFVAQLQDSLRELKIGILRVEEANLETLELRLTVEEDLDCSGLPVTGETVCTYDEGFIGGLLFGFTGKRFHVEEIDCWASGDRVCRFAARVEN